MKGDVNSESEEDPFGEELEVSFVIFLLALAVNFYLLLAKWTYDLWGMFERKCHKMSHLFKYTPKMHLID